MAYEVGGVGTLAEIIQYYKGQKRDTTTIELMEQTNEILVDVPFREANGVQGHETRVRDGLPDVYFRRMYRGTPVSKSSYNRVQEGFGMLEGRMELDVKEKELWAEAFNAYRLSEAKGFAQALNNKAACLMFYGDHTTNPDEFDGLATRYAYLDQPHVIDAGGVYDEAAKTKLTSMYLVAWGPDTAHALFPKHSIAGMNHKDLGQYTTQDSEGRKFEVFGDLWSWNLGLTVRDWRSVVRICNIDVEKALDLREGDDGFINLQRLTIQAKNLLPAGMRSKAVWYCHEAILTAIEQQAIDSRSVYLNYGQYFGSSEVPMLHHRPLRQCDAIILTEQQVKAKAA